MSSPALSHVESFYRASVAALRLLDVREARGLRFGSVADQGWKALGGELEPRDRLDWLVRDAAALQPPAFSPRVIFELPGLTDDEPMGSDWPMAPAALSVELLREAGKAAAANLPLTAKAVLTAALSAWRLAASEPTSALVEQARTIAPTHRVLVAGPSAICALGLAAEGRRDLNLGDQTLCLAASPGERHLFGLALLIAGPRARQLTILAPSDDIVALAAARGYTRFDTTILSDDAEPTLREAVSRLTRASG